MTNAKAYSIFKPAGLGLAVFVTAIASILLTRDQTEVSAVWPSNAIILSVLILSVRAQWRILLPFAFVGNFLANIIAGNGAFMATFASAANVIEVLLCAYIIGAPSAGGRVFHNAEIFAKFVFGSISGALTSSVIATTALSFHAQAVPFDVFASWFMADCLGLLIFTPIISTLLAGDVRHAVTGGNTPSAALGMWLMFFLGVFAIFAQAKLNLLPAAPLLVIVMAFAMVPESVALAIGIMSIFAIDAAVFGAGPQEFISGSVSSRLWYLQAFMSLLVLSGMPTAIALAQRRLLQLNLAVERDRAEAAANAKSEFLANMSHELRTPLNSVIGFSRLLAESKALSPQDARYAGLIETSSRATLSIINDVLEFSGVEKGVTVLRPRPFSLRALLTSVVDSISPLSDAKGLAVSCTFDRSLAAAHIGDPDRLRQILVNLMSNAVKFTAKGSVAIEALADPATNGKQPVRILIKDTGAGIPAEQHARIFERFVRYSASPQTASSGAGLGLSIAKALAALMGGEIGLISEPGAGSTFSVRLTLPLSDAVHAQTPGDSVRVQPCHILVVDDVQLNCELARSFLEKAGHLVDVSLDGQDALRKCNATRYDLILMDVQMPVFDGLMATRALRDSRCASSGTPVIALTAGAMPDQIKKCLAAGMNGHVAKPILEGDLTAAVVKWAAPGSRAVSSTTAPPLKFDGFQAMYLDQLRSDSDALRGAIQNERPYREIAGLIHQIAGSAGSFGFSGISEAALAMDAQFEQGQTPQASDVDVLLELMDSALAQFEPTQKESAPH